MFFHISIILEILCRRLNRPAVLLESLFGKHPVRQHPKTRNSAARSGLLGMTAYTGSCGIGVQ
jgi:hypothetical protein